MTAGVFLFKVLLPRLAWEIILTLLEELGLPAPQLCYPSSRIFPWPFWRSYLIHCWSKRWNIYKDRERERHNTGWCWVQGQLTFQTKMTQRYEQPTVPSGSMEALKWGHSYVKFSSSAPQNWLRNVRSAAEGQGRGCLGCWQRNYFRGSLDSVGGIIWFSPHIHTEHTQLIPVDFEGSYTCLIRQNFTVLWLDH